MEFHFTHLIIGKYLQVGVIENSNLLSLLSLMSALKLLRFARVLKLLF